MSTPLAVGTNRTSPEISDKLTVFFDGGCPICRREIKFYSGLRGAEQLRWVDVTTAPDDDLPAGATREQLLKRFHIETDKGELVDGPPAFVEIWKRLTAFRPLVPLFSIPGVLSLSEYFYTLFLKVRPKLQRFF